MSMPVSTHQFSPDNRVEIVSSPNALPEGPFYRVRVKDELAKRLGLGKWATLVFYHPYFSHGIDVPKDAPSYLAIHCRVLRFRSIPENVANRSGFESADNVICVDQTLRNALGLPFRIFPDLRRLDMYLLPADRPCLHSIKDWFAALFGVRYLVARPKKPDVPDIEKGFARLPADTLKTLGVEQGDNILIERPFPRKGRDGMIRSFGIDQLSVSLFEAPSAMMAGRIELQKNDPDRYVDIGKALYGYGSFRSAEVLGDTQGLLSLQSKNADSVALVEPDVPPIFVDAGIREAPSEFYRIRDSATVFSPVIVRRSIASALARESLQSGATFGVAFFNVFYTLSQESDLKDSQTVLIALLCSIVITGVLLGFKLRRQI